LYSPPTVTPETSIAAAPEGEAPARAPVSALGRARQVVLAIVLVALVGTGIWLELLHLPGMIFIAVARAAFGAVNGFFLGYGASILAVTAPFLLVRGMRTTRERAWQPRWRLLRRLLDGVEKHPIRSVAVLRLILWLSPPLDYALAFTSIRTRDYILGSALGLAPCIGAVIWGLGWWWT
jgi:uncharacterized membrane protein YdjX (TVP38/TMEM64 family)